MTINSFITYDVTVASSVLLRIFFACECQNPFLDGCSNDIWLLVPFNFLLCLRPQGALFKAVGITPTRTSASEAVTYHNHDELQIYWVCLQKSSLAEVYTAYHRRLFMHGRLERYQYIFSVFSGFHSSILTLIHIPSEFLIAKMHWFCNKALMTSSVKFCIYTNHGRVSQWTICISSSVASLSERISFWNLYTLSDLLAFHEFHRSLQWYGVKLQRI